MEQLAAEKPIEMDVSCARCGYNLRGLAPEGRCPECATPVGRSLRGDRLAYSDPAWVEKVAQGANLLVFSGCMGMVLRGSTTIIAKTASPGVVSLFSQTAHVAPALLAMIAYWLGTTPEPRGVRAEGLTSNRQLVRVLAVITTLLVLSSQGMSRTASSVGAWPGVAASGAGVVLLAAAFSYGRRLALRLPDARLARTTRIVMIGYVAKESLLVAWMAGRASGVPIAWRGAMIWAATFGLGQLIFGIWTVNLLLRYSAVLRDAAREARSTWARPFD